MVPEEKYKNIEKRKQRRTEVQFKIVGFAAADYFGILEVNRLVPEMHLREAPQAHHKCRRDQ